MAPKPSSLPRWADGVDAAIIEPLTAEKDLGWVPGEPPPAAVLNWWQKLVYQWTAYLDGLFDTLRATVLNITARWTFSAGADIDSGATVDGGLAVTGGATVAGGLVVSSGGVAAVGNSNITGTLGIVGNTTVGGTLGVTGAATVGSLSTGGGAVNAGAGAISGGAVSGTTGAFSGNTTVGGTLGVTGNTTVGGTLGVTGLLSGDSISVSDDITVGGNVTVTASLTAPNVSGNMAVSGTVTAASFNGAITTEAVTYLGTTLLNSWTSNASTSFYYKDRNGRLWLYLEVKGGTGVIFNLPAGYRPSVAQAIVGNQNSADFTETAAIYVNTNGDVTYTRGGTVSGPGEVLVVNGSVRL